tara:strand:- start:174 stop:965 length:792 start_codon:yes stop_codon:yes gene_type:complete
MAKKIMPDELWDIIKPLLPPEPPKPDGGRPRVSNRAALTGILFVLKSGIPWEMLPQEMGCGSGVTCWRRLRDWHVEKASPGVAGTPARSGTIGLGSCLHGQCLHQGKKGGSATGPNPTDRGRPRTKRHLLTDRKGTPLAVVLSGANMHDSVPLSVLLDTVSPVAGRLGRPRQRPRKLHADKAYDFARCRRACHRRHTQARIARRGVKDTQRLGRHRWVVERTFAWLEQMRRLATRYERRTDIHYAFTLLGCSLICLKQLTRQF